MYMSSGIAICHDFCVETDRETIQTFVRTSEMNDDGDLDRQELRNQHVMYNILVWRQPWVEIKDIEIKQANKQQAIHTLLKTVHALNVYIFNLFWGKKKQIHTFFNRSSLEGHLGFFQALATTYSAAMNIVEQMLL